MNAYEELLKFIQDDEVVEGIVFGEWGWGGYREPDNPPVPKDKMGVLLTLEQAKPMMMDWCFDGGYGAPDCYATYIWTNKHVIWVTQYDGSTTLDFAPRHPTNVMPSMPGG
jgi:hypothetical protein